jgi:predicted enzyme related to lactoylglutathione lyase
MVKGLAFFAYPADDVASMRHWYEQHLGLHFGAPYVEDGFERYNEAAFGDACFSLMWTKWTDRPAGSASGAYFEVDDVDAAVTSLEAKGVATRDYFDGPVCRQVSFSDLEGNKVTIHQVRRETRS